MSTFEKNIISIYGDKGKIWLSELTRLEKEISAKWSLSELKPVNNLSYNYVLSGSQDTQPIILKLGLDAKGLKREASALRAFSGCGVVNVLAQQDGALLLERAVPGDSLKAYLQVKDRETIRIACDMMKRLHQASIPRNNSFPHIRDWFSALDKNWNIPVHYLEKARKLKDQLFTTSPKLVLLHGDQGCSVLEYSLVSQQIIKAKSIFK